MENNEQKINRKENRDKQKNNKQKINKKENRDKQ